MANLQDIFDKMERREWDWFGLTNNPSIDVNKYSNLVINHDSGLSGEYSLADLLTNTSWCKAVWGEERIGNSVEGWCDKWQDGSVFAFQVLQQQSQQEAIDYIFKTMLNG